MQPAGYSRAHSKEVSCAGTQEGCRSVQKDCWCWTHVMQKAGHCGMHGTVQIMTRMYYVKRLLLAVYAPEQSCSTVLSIGAVVQQCPLLSHYLRAYLDKLLLGKTDIHKTRSYGSHESSGVRSGSCKLHRTCQPNQRQQQ
jgi:hypothetical protein